MKKTTTAAKKRPTPKPELKWQTGEYARHAEYSFILPYQFLLLCKLMDTTPEDMLLHFMDNLAHASWKREGRDEAKQHLVNYFIAHGYGQQFYTEAEIRQMFTQMDAVGMLFPWDGRSKLLGLYSDWRKRHHNYWFKKWWRKPRRKLEEK